MSVSLVDCPGEDSGRRAILQSPQRLVMTRRAVAYAAQLHAGQWRLADRAPFIVHPLEVACLLHHAGARDHVIAAGVLHDVIEKTDADADDLRARFGSRITTLVLAVTEDERIIGYTERKAALCEQVAEAGHDALMVFAADKVSKARELSLVNARTGQQCVRARDDRLAYYSRCLQVIEQLLPNSSLVGELRKTLERAARRRYSQQIERGSASWQR
jgi:(p)ppGpp synthase/HD superfamily hydrolase